MTPTQNLAWSAEGETLLRRQISSLWMFTWTFLIAGVMALAEAYLVHWMLSIAGAFFGLAVAALFAMQRSTERLGVEAQMTPAGFRAGSGMLSNKPRSTANLTTWFHHPGRYHPAERFVCPCGLGYFWSDAQWLPNIIREQTADLDGPEYIVEEQIPREGATAFVAAQGSGREFTSAPESPLFVDPGGGRYVLLCRCGRGHFKLREAKAPA